jgi:hypothetical protein
MLYIYTAMTSKLSLRFYCFWYLGFVCLRNHKDVHTHWGHSSDTIKLFFRVFLYQKHKKLKILSFFKTKLLETVDVLSLFSAMRFRCIVMRCQCSTITDTAPTLLVTHLAYRKRWSVCLKLWRLSAACFICHICVKNTGRVGRAFFRYRIENISVFPHLVLLRPLW